jgi:hypothetical protein
MSHQGMSGTGAGKGLRAVVLVEGESDRAALETLAARRGRDLADEGVAVVPIGGATAIRRFLDVYGPRGWDVRVGGLCDAGEERDFRRGLVRAGLGGALERGGDGAHGRSDMEALGFFVCDADLEDELIRALGTAAVEEVIESRGDLRAFRTMQKQPAQRSVPVDRQLRRFLGTRSGRKIEYASLLVDALDLARVPRPLDGVLAGV